MAQSAALHTTRRLALARPLPLTLARTTAPPLATGLATKRHESIQTPSPATPASPDQGLRILANQRLYRPLAPHLQIYKPQVTWTLSIANRITGCVLSGGFYVFGAWYALGPLVGLGFGSAGLTAGFAAWPLVAKVGVKGVLAAPFVFHGLNGVRHLVWDLGRGLNNQSVKRSGWAVVGLSVVGTLALFLI